MRFFRTTRIATGVAIAILSLYSCGSDDPAGPDTPVPSSPTDITLSQESLSFEAVASGVSLAITAPARPSLSSSEKWVNITDGTYKDYRITIGVDVSENTSFDSRSATLTIRSGSLSRTVSISQKGRKRPLTLSLSEWEAPTSGGSVDVKVSAPADPTIEGAPSWVSVEKGEFVLYSSTLRITVSPNDDSSIRSAQLTIKSEDLSVNFTITQKGQGSSQGDLATTLVTKNPTSEANSLFQYLLSQYGGNIISSVMAEVNWNYNEATRVYNMTGKYPAINCYDFIHIYVPRNNWIDYTDLTPVTSWHDAGGIVSLMWHFNVPLDSSTTPGTDGSGVTCSPDKTTFEPRNVFTTGSWENKWFYEQMDKVVDILLALQDRGIAALWRPFHEAAGNYTAKTWNGTSWFWWGKNGPDVCVRLWRTMFEYFEEKGVRNLIWIWTTQNYNGNSAQYGVDSDWYPGDGYVDMIGRDLYGETASANAREFAEIQKRYPTKMITLAECGRSGEQDFCSVPSLWSAGALWSYFMPWYGSSMPDEAWWKSAMSSSSVITRDELPSNL